MGAAGPAWAGAGGGRGEGARSEAYARRLPPLPSNPDALRALIDPKFADDPANCPPAGALGAARKPRPASPDAAPLVRALALALAATVVAGAGVGMAGIKALKAHPHAFIAAAVGAQVGAPLAGAALAAANGLSAGLVLALLLSAGLTAACAWVWRDQLALCGGLLGVAARATTGSLVAASATLSVAGAAASALLGAGALAGVANGQLAASAGGGGPACKWQPAPLAPAAAALCALAAAWAAAAALASRTFVAAGAAGQWYGAESGGAAAVRGETAWTSLRHAAGPQLGTVAAAGAVTVAADALRAAVDSATTDADGRPTGFLAALAASLARGGLAFIEYLTRFAVVAAAISGGSLLASGKSATRLLKSVALSAVAVWYVPGLVLTTAAGGAAVLWGAAAAVAARGVAFPHAQAYVGGAAALSLFLMLSWLAGVVLAVVDALFLLFALDRAAGAAPQPDVAAALARVPCGVLVSQPDGGVAFGAGKRVTVAELDGGAAGAV